MWTLLMWMSNVLLHILLCCHPKTTLMARWTHDGQEAHHPLPRSSASNNSSLYLLQQFSLPGLGKATQCFCCYCFVFVLLLPKLHHYETLMYCLNSLILRSFSSDGASETEAWSPQAEGQWQPAATTTLPSHWSSKPQFWAEVFKNHIFGEEVIQWTLKTSHRKLRRGSLAQDRCGGPSRLPVGIPVF